MRLIGRVCAIDSMAVVSIHYDLSGSREICLENLGDIDCVGTKDDSR